MFPLFYQNYKKTSMFGFFYLIALAKSQPDLFKTKTIGLNYQ